MPAISKIRPLASATLADFAAIILAFFDDLRRRGGVSENQIRLHGYIARHFLIWVELTGIDLKTVDGPNHRPLSAA